jgi:hypothetical protein
MKQPGNSWEVASRGVKLSPPLKSKGKISFFIGIKVVRIGGIFYM